MSQDEESSCGDWAKWNLVWNGMLDMLKSRIWTMHILRERATFLYPQSALTKREANSSHPTTEVLRTATVAICGFILNFAYGWGGMAWVYCAEMFPQKHRTKAGEPVFKSSKCQESHLCILCTWTLLQMQQPVGSVGLV